MSVYKASLSGGNNVLPSPWADVKRTTSSIVLLDETGTDTGKTIGYSAFPPYEVSTLAVVQDGTGDASWVIAEAVEGGHGQQDKTTWVPLVASGFTPGATYNVRCFGSYNLNNNSRSTQWRVNVGADQELVIHDGTTPNITNDVRFEGVTADVSGDILIEWRQGDSSNERGYAGAVYIEDAAPPGPSLTVTQATLTPGGTISGTYADYATIPTTLTVSDGTNTITIASPTITDNGDGTGSFSGTMPALPTTGTANLVLFGDVTVELS